MPKLLQVQLILNCQYPNLRICPCYPLRGWEGSHGRKKGHQLLEKLSLAVPFRVVAGACAQAISEWTWREKLKGLRHPEKWSNSHPWVIDRFSRPTDCIRDMLSNSRVWKPPDTVVELWAKSPTGTAPAVVRILASTWCLKLSRAPYSRLDRLPSTSISYVFKILPSYLLRI